MRLSTTKVIKVNNLKESINDYDKRVMWLIRERHNKRSHLSFRVLSEMILLFPKAVYEELLYLMS